MLYGFMIDPCCLAVMFSPVGTITLTAMGILQQLLGEHITYVLSGGEIPSRTALSCRGKK